MKQSEIKELSLDDLREKIENMQNSYDNLKMAHAITPLENPMLLRTNRRLIAKLFTELQKRQNQ